MFFEEFSWILSNIDQLYPSLKKQTLAWDKPFRFVPRFLQKYFKGLRQHFRKVSVIVQMEPSLEINSCFSSIAQSTGCKIKMELPIIDSFTTKVNVKALEKLMKDQHVMKIWYDDEVKAILDHASTVVKAPKLWELQHTGKGVGVAVIDTGIYPHPDLSGRITGFKDFINQKSTAYDDNGHGTHVAGAIASDGMKSNQRYQGIAPQANVIGVKVLNKKGAGSMSNVIRGIQWCIDKKESLGIRVINISLGSSATQSYREDPICQAVEKAWNNGIVVCIAAGNEGPEVQSILTPAIDPAAITVGAINDKNSPNPSDYEIAEYSSRGPTIDNLVKPDILCPGSNIISLRSPNSTIDKGNRYARVGENYLSLSGTSMATPICSGIAALMLEAKNSLTPNEVKSIMMETAQPLPAVGETLQGKGLLDAEEIANQLKASS